MMENRIRSGFCTVLIGKFHFPVQQIRNQVMYALRVRVKICKDIGNLTEKMTLLKKTHQQMKCFKLLYIAVGMSTPNGFQQILFFCQQAAAAGLFCFSNSTGTPWIVGTYRSPPAVI